MRTKIHAVMLVGAVAFSALLAGCAPAAEQVGGAAPSETAAPTVDNSYLDDQTPVPTADPVPAKTTAPGGHLEVVGAITALGDATIDVDGVTFSLTAATEIKGVLAVGAQVKLEYVVNGDGSRTVIEAKGAGFFDNSRTSPAD
jgi:hypothetical protein